MSQGSIMYENSGAFDFTFLNPFYQINDSYLGSRFGYAQFILVTCLIISIISLIIIFKNIIPVLGFLAFWLIQYYGISCLLIPDNHTRCYLWTWIFNILPIIIATLVILGMFGFKNQATGLFTNMTNSNKKKKEKKEEEKNE